jgi:hypothetical protein
MVAVTLVAAPDFSLAISGASSQSTTPGQSASYNLSVAPLNGSYPGTITFAVSGLPTGATATFSPSSVASTSGAQTVALTIQTSAASAMESVPAPPAGRGLKSIAWATLVLPLFGVARMRRQGSKLLRILFLAWLLVGGIVVSATLTGCGSMNGFFAQAEKSYSVTVTATGGSLQHSAIVTLNVE